MTKIHTNIAFGILAAVAAVAISGSAIRAQGGRSTADGIYTAEQATRGQTLYGQQCGFCHGETLEGSDVIPALKGDAFVAAWRDKSVLELYERIQTSMPATSPGSLTPEQTADSVAYILSVLEVPAGTTELGTDAAALKEIRIAVE